MNIPKVYESEYCFCRILWEEEPISCAELARKCRESLGWSRTTTYTVIKRLEERGVLKKEESIVSSIVSKEEIQISEFNELLQKKFDGSLTEFIALFTKRQKITQQEMNEIYDMLKEYKEG